LRAEWSPLLRHPYEPTTTFSVHEVNLYEWLNQHAIQWSHDFDYNNNRNNDEEEDERKASNHASNDVIGPLQSVNRKAN